LGRRKERFERILVYGGDSKNRRIQAKRRFEGA
jgi:hypothetical protein